MCKKVVEVKKEGGGSIILPGQVDVGNPVFELRKDLLEHIAITRDQFEEVYRDISLKYDLLESHLQDAEKVCKAKVREVIKELHRVEKVVIEYLPKT